MRHVGCEGWICRMLHGARNALDRPEVSLFREIRLKTRVRFPNGIRHTDVLSRRLTNLPFEGYAQASACMGDGNRTRP